jgi:hypothetical protein
MNRFLQCSVGVLCLSLAALISFHLATKPARAEPDSAVNYLMNESVSMFEWGNYMLAELLNDSILPVFGWKGASGHVKYDWGANRLKLEVTDYTRFATSQEARKHVEEQLKQIRQELTRDDFALLGEVYTHDGFKPTSEPEGLGTKLGQIMELSFTAFANASTIRCQGRLASDEILWSEEDSSKPKR